MNFDLLLRCAIIQVAISLACAWIQSFYEPWPLVHAFDLADTAQEQLFQSLGVRFGGSLVHGVVLAILSTVKSNVVCWSVSLCYKLHMLAKCVQLNKEDHDLHENRHGRSEASN